MKADFMKRWMVFFLVILMLAAPAAQSAELENPGTAMRKLQRGFLNIALAPMDLFAVMRDGMKQETFIPGWASGLFKGSIFAVGRAVAGAYETVTFFIPAPSGYAPIIQPEFAWQHFEDSRSN